MNVAATSATGRAHEVQADEADWLLSVSSAQPGRRPATQRLQTAGRHHLHVTFHGVLYNADALAAELGVAVTALTTAADVILAASERWGSAAFRRLRGVFAVSLADAAQNHATVARDPLGSHPIFYTRLGDRWLFADSTRCLLRQAGVSAAFNRAALADHLCHRWPQPSETFFAAIQRVPPGCLVRVSPSGARTERYWDPAPPGHPVRWADAEEVGEFSARLDQAVDRCMSTGPTGVFLSGGLDSISITAVAADRAAALGRRPPWALSLALPDVECDERDAQTSVARALGLPQHLLDFDEAVGPRGLLLAGTELNRDLSSPLMNIWAPAYLSLASRGAADGVRTILTGSGGDEWLSVSPYLSADLMARGDVAGWLHFLGAFRRSYRHPVLRHLRLAAWTFGARPLASRALSRLMGDRWGRQRHRRATRHDPPWVAPDPRLRAEQVQRSRQTLEDVDPPHGFYVREVRSGLEHFLTSWELEEQYELGRRAGVRFLHPYWDPDLVDVLYRTPPHILLAGGRAKSLVRETLARRFPALGLEGQRKVAATGFYRSIVRRQTPAAAGLVGDCRRLADLGVITRAAAGAYGRDGFGGPGRGLTHRWDLLNLETWVRSGS